MLPLIFLAILPFTTSLLLAIYSYHKAINTTKFWGNFRMQNLSTFSNLMLPCKVNHFFARNYRYVEKKMKLNFWRNLWLSLPKLLLLLLGKVDGNPVSWWTNASWRKMHIKVPNVFVSIKYESYMRLNDRKTMYSIDKTELWKPRLCSLFLRTLINNMKCFI